MKTNLNIERKLRSIANPISEYRYDFIKELKRDDDKDLMDSVGDVEEILGDMTVGEKNEDVKDIDSNLTNKDEGLLKTSTFLCKVCGSEYKKIGNLNLHMKKKHQEENSKPEIKCKVCGVVFTLDSDLKKHMPNHFKCEECSIPFEDLRA